MIKSYSIPVLIALAACFCSCSKSDSNNTLPANYKIDGVHDLTVQPVVFPSNGLALKVSYTGAIQERVSLSLEGVPPGCTSNISVSAGYPEFSSELSVVDSSAAPGTYPLRLVCEGSQTGKSSYQFNLIIKPEDDYGSVYLGTYPNSYNSCNYGVVYPATVTASDKVNTIYLTNFDNTGNTVYAKISNEGQAITIPQQTVNGITYSCGNAYIYHGGGNFSFQYNKMISGNSFSCIASLMK